MFVFDQETGSRAVWVGSFWMMGPLAKNRPGQPSLCEITYKVVCAFHLAGTL